MQVVITGWLLDGVGNLAACNIAPESAVLLRAGAGSHAVDFAVMLLLPGAVTDNLHAYSCQQCKHQIVVAVMHVKCTWCCQITVDSLVHGIMIMVQYDAVTTIAVAIHEYADHHTAFQCSLSHAVQSKWMCLQPMCSAA